MILFSKRKLSNKLAIISILISGILFFGQQANACAWGECIAAQTYKQTMENIALQINGAIMGALKQAAAEMINNTVNQLVSGGGPGGGPLFVTNWENYLIQEPRKQTDIWMNDFFTTISAGTASTANYKAAGGEGVVGSYSGQLVQQARKATTNATTSQYNLNQYVSDPSQMFDAGNWRAFNSYISNPSNNSFGMTLTAQDAYMQKMEEEKRKAEIQAIAYQGFMAQKNGSQVITPGSTIKDIQSQTEDLGNKIVAGATNVPEVITAVVTKLVTKTIRQGIGNVQTNIQREINNTTYNLRSNVQNQVTNSGPGSIFKPRY